MIRVLIVDDSALMRQIISRILSQDPEIEVIGVAQDPLVAREKIKALNPDVLTLDVEMPRMDGLSFLEKIMRLRPMPVVMVSSLTQKSADVTLQALEIGAVDFVAKPRIDIQQGMEAVGAELVAKVKAAAQARVSARATRVAPRPTLRTLTTYRTTDTIVAIGASTGGVEALREVISALPADSPPVLIAQHMPEQFTKRFAERLDSLSQVTVREAEHGARVIPGHVFIAPGNRHLELVRSGGEYRCALNDGPLVSGHRPSVDVLFKSVAVAAGANAVGVILTGMGKDGADGLMAVRAAGAATLGQDESTSLVYGMPRVARELGAVMQEKPLGAIAEEILRLCQQGQHGASRSGSTGSRPDADARSGGAQSTLSRPI